MNPINSWNMNALIGMGALAIAWPLFIAWLANPAWPLLWRRKQ